MRYLDELRRGLVDALDEIPETLIMGEDVRDPYGGAFKVTKGLSSRFPDRVIQTPISEAGFVGVAAGLAYMGYRPIVEIMFCDFLPLIADALVNGASKLDALKKDGLLGDVLVRTPAGGRRGYGPIHSQSLERIFFGWPGISVIAPNLATSPRDVFMDTIHHGARIKLFIENKSDYTEVLWEADSLRSLGMRRELSDDHLPTARITTAAPPAPADVTILTYGGMGKPSLEAAHRLLIEDEVTVDVIIPSLICPIVLDPLLLSLEQTQQLIIAEEGYAPAGWASYVLGALAASRRSHLALDRVRIVGPRFEPIPANPVAEVEHLPGSDAIITAARSLL